MDYIIRNYIEDDYDAVVDIMCHSFESKFRKLYKFENEELVDFIKDIEIFPKDQSDGLLVAEAGGRVIGAVILNWYKLYEESTLDVLSLRKKYGHRKILRVIVSAIALMETPEKDECYISSIATLPECRGKGVGRALLKAAEGLAEEKGFNKITLHVTSTNTEAEKLYKRLGFRTRKVFKSLVLKRLLDEASFKYMVKRPGDNPASLNIGMFTDTYMPQINGVATSIKILTEELEKMGHKVYIITIKEGGIRSEFDGKILRKPGISVLKGTDYKLANIFMSEKTQDIIEDMNLDIVHSHTEFSIGLLGTYVARKYKIPQVHTYHTMYDDCVHYVTNFKPFQKVAIEFIKIYVREFADVCKRVIVPTKKTEQVLLDYEVDTPLEIIPTGIDFSKFQVSSQSPEVLELKESLGIKEEDFICLNIGRLSKEKKTEDILRSVSDLLSDYPNLKLIVIGDGPEYDTLEKIARKHPDNIKLLGRVPWEKIGYYYKLGKCFITASRFETQGLTVIEALSSDLPVICTDDEAFIDIVKEGYNGFLFKDNDELKEKILQMMDENNYESIIENTSNSVVKYSSEYFAETVYNLYHSLQQKNAT